MHTYFNQKYVNALLDMIIGSTYITASVPCTQCQVKHNIQSNLSNVFHPILILLCNCAANQIVAIVA